MGVRCKMRCLKLEQMDGQEGGTVRLAPVTGYGGEENKEFWKYTPNGTFEFNSINPLAFDQFKLGREYYVDITPVPEVVTLKARLAEVEKLLPQAQERSRLNTDKPDPWYHQQAKDLEREQAALNDRIKELEARA